MREKVYPSWRAPNISLELTGLFWSFAGLAQVAIEVGGRSPAAWAVQQLSREPLGGHIRLLTRGESKLQPKSTVGKLGVA